MHSRFPAMLLSVLAMLALLASGCRPGTEPEPLSRVVTTIPALAGLIEPMLPDEIECLSLLDTGQSIHGHRLTTGQIAQARAAQIIVGIGLGLEEGSLDYFARTLRPQQELAIFATLVGIEGGAAHHHTHEPGEVCVLHDGTNPHLWLEPALCRTFVGAMAQIIADRADDEAMASEIRTRAAAWQARIDDIDEAYRTRLAPFSGKAILTQHAAFGGMLEAYGLREIAVHRAGGDAAPTPGEVAEALRTVQAEAVAAIFIEPQMPDAFARRLAAESGLPLGTLDPLGDGDWEAMMRRNLDALVDALERSAAREPAETDRP